MPKVINHLFIIVFFILATTFLVWLPHYMALSNLIGLNFSNGFSTIYRNFDGLEYVVIAKSFYNPGLIASIPLSQPPIYYASHFPGYAMLIFAFAPVLGFLKSMLFVSLISTIFAAFAFYFLVRDFKLTTQPLILTLVFLTLPARWLIVRSVGSAEPLFIFFTILAVYFFMKYELQHKYNLLIFSAISAMLAQVTRPPGILLFIALALYIHYKAWIEAKQIGLTKAITRHLRFFPFAVVPLALLGIFYIYSQNYHDFFAYFHSGDNIHLTFPPFQSLNKSEFWVGQIWLEDIIYIFILEFFAGLLLIKQKLYPMAFFVLTYVVASSFVAHRDISRYTLPVVPFVIIAYEKVLVSKEFKIVLVILALAIYLYSQNFILANTVPLPDLTLYN